MVWVSVKVSSGRILVLLCCQDETQIERIAVPSPNSMPHLDPHFHLPLPVEDVAELEADPMNTLRRLSPQVS